MIILKPKEVIMSINVNTMQTIAERVKDALLVVGRKIDDCNAVEHALNGGSFSS